MTKKNIFYVRFHVFKAFFLFRISNSANKKEVHVQTRETAPPRLSVHFQPSNDDNDNSSNAIVQDYGFPPLREDFVIREDVEIAGGREASGAEEERNVAEEEEEDEEHNFSSLVTHLGGVRGEI